MSKFIVEESFWELFPDAKIGVILLKNYENSEKSPQELVTLLEESNVLARRHLKAEVFSENKVIQAYRQAYQKFKTKKGARCSLEALIKRAGGDNPVKTINPLVDIYNAASLRFALPLGAEDIDTFVGDLRLTITEGNDEFYLIGEQKNNPTLPKELCYKDDVGAVCRCFNWRDGMRTMITERTTNAFIVSELIESERLEDLKDTLTFVGEQSTKYLKARVCTFILHRENPSIELIRKNGKENGDGNKGKIVGDI